MKGHCPKEIKSAIVLALGLGVSFASSAATLGPVYVNSYMGQPLNATIPMNSLTAIEAQNARITLASATEYSKRGVVKTPEQSALSFRLVPNGSSYNIAVASSKNIDEPFVNFVLSFTSGNEVLTREYSIFLDPEPAATAGIAPIVQKQPVELSTEPNTTIKPATSEKQGWGNIPADAKPVDLTQQTPLATPTNSKPPVNVKVRSEQQPSSQNSQSSHADPRLVNRDKYGPVKPGETLYSIAKMLRPSKDIPIHTMMRAIFNTNRHAFARGNIDNLMAGQTLTIPSDISAAAKKARSTHTPAQKENDLSDSEPKMDSQIADVLNNDNSAEFIRPLEMTPEEVAEAEKIAQELADGLGESKPIEKNPQASEDSEGLITEEKMTEETVDALEENSPVRKQSKAPEDANSPDTEIKNNLSLDDDSALHAEEQTTEKDSSTDTSMLLDSPDSIDDSPSDIEKEQAEPIANVSEEENVTDALQPTKLEPEEPSEISTENASLPPEDNVNAQETDNTSGLPFGLKLWQLLLAGGSILALIILGLLASKKKSAQTIEEIDLSEEEVDALAFEMIQNENNLTDSHSDGFGAFDEESVDDLSDQLSPEDEQFFADASATVDNFDDDFSTETLPEDISQLDSLDDFFAEDGEIADSSFDTNADTTSIETDFDLDDLDNFFADDLNSEPQHSAMTPLSTTAAVTNDLQKENDSEKIERPDFDGLDEFFYDDTQPPSSLEQGTPLENELSDDDFDFFTETASESPDKIISSDKEADSELNLLDDELFVDTLDDETDIIEEPIETVDNKLLADTLDDEADIIEEPIETVDNELFADTLDDEADIIEEPIETVDNELFADTLDDEADIIEEPIETVDNKLSNDISFSLEMNTDDIIEQPADELTNQESLHTTSDDEFAFFTNTLDEEIETTPLEDDLSIELSDSSSIQPNDFDEDITPEGPISQKSEAPEIPSYAQNEADVQAMGINLDLADAYIKSGVKPEKARMWLEEVIAKGTDIQKSQAEELLKKIS